MPAPQVIISEIDASQFVLSVAKTVPAIVATATKGEIGVATEITTERRFYELFGQPVTSGFGGLAAIKYLRQGNALTFIRVADASVREAFVDIENVATSAKITGSTPEPYYFQDGVNDELALVVDGNINIIIDFPAGVLSIAQVVDQINGQAGSIVTATSSVNIITITSNTAGANSAVTVLSDTTVRTATVNTLNGFTSTAGSAASKSSVATSGLVGSDEFDIKPDSGSDENVAVVRVDTVTKTISLTTGTSAEYTGPDISGGVSYANTDVIDITVDGTNYAHTATGASNIVTGSPFTTAAAFIAALELDIPALSGTGILSANTTGGQFVVITSQETGSVDSTITAAQDGDGAGGSGGAIYDDSGAFTALTGADVPVATVVNDINTAFGHEVCVINGSNQIQINSDTIGAAGSVKLLDSATPASSDALYALLGFTAQTVPAPGAGEFLTSSATTPATSTAGVDAVAGYTTQSAASVKYTVTGGPLDLVFNIDNAEFDVTVTFADGVYSVTDVVSTINTAAGINYASVYNSSVVRISSLTTGTSSRVEIDASSDAAILTLLGFTSGDIVTGTAASPSARIEAATKGTWLNGGTAVVSGTGTKIQIYDPAGKLLETIQNFSYNDADSNFIETQVNGNSLNVIITLDDLFTGTIPDGTYTFNYGLNGDNVTDAQLVSAIDKLTDDEQTTHNIITAPGYSGEAVINKLISVAEQRGDSLALVDVPFDLSNDQAIQWHNGQGNLGRDTSITSNYAAIYHPWLLSYNEFRQEAQWMPPSVFVLEQMTISDNLTDPWFAAAGLNRGIISNVTDVRTIVDKATRDTMYADENGNAINPIISIKGSNGGITIWGARTAQRSLSALNRIGPRRMMIFIKTAIKGIARGFIFEPNDDVTKTLFIERANKLLGDVVLRRGISQFRVVMDATNNPPELAAQRILHGDIFVTAIESVEIIEIPFTITPQGVTL